MIQFIKIAPHFPVSSHEVPQIPVIPKESFQFGIGNLQEQFTLLCIPGGHMPLVRKHTSFVTVYIVCY